MSKYTPDESLAEARRYLEGLRNLGKPGHQAVREVETVSMIVYFRVRRGMFVDDAVTLGLWKRHQ